MMKWKVHTKSGASECSGTLGELLRVLPYVLGNGQVLPPYAVCRSLFLRGQVGGGQGDMVSWDPFELSESDYQKLLAESDLSSAQLPDDLEREISSEEDWMVFLMSPDDHQLALRLMHLDKKARLSFSEYESKRQSGDSDEASNYLDQHLKASEEFTKLLKDSGLA